MDKELGRKEFTDNEYFKDKDGKKITKIEIKIDRQMSGSISIKVL